MNFSKTDIVKNITKQSSISTEEGSKILELLLFTIKNTARSKNVKLSGFGSFKFKRTPKRIGRNPKTKDSYIIPEINKLNFKPSLQIKENIN
tara:strand:+ start:148 stop:423 length:276 start_codon:yes stop_codon:yes gene_type:complete